MKLLPVLLATAALLKVGSGAALEPYEVDTQSAIGFRESSGYRVDGWEMRCLQSRSGGFPPSMSCRIRQISGKNPVGTLNTTGPGLVVSVGIRRGALQGVSVGVGNKLNRGSTATLKAGAAEAHFAQSDSSGAEVLGDQQSRAFLDEFLSAKSASYDYVDGAGKKRKGTVKAMAFGEIYAKALELTAKEP